jgi:hypothetical protein
MSAAIASIELRTVPGAAVVHGDHTAVLGKPVQVLAQMGQKDQRDACSRAELAVGELRARRRDRPRRRFAKVLRCA